MKYLKDETLYFWGRKIIKISSDRPSNVKCRLCTFYVICCIPSTLDAWEDFYDAREKFGNCGFAYFKELKYGSFR